ncbi:kinase-like domain-containing protein [Gigaspora rosea]|uniref:Kinase-like domain-containing protein n=1 Tax=Gigaspora rosea TaxID=44941 RepID=A0A397TVR9_9GLOM|nr:kinase-like domain-containing protein [Gigaspora rosea]
MSNEDLRLAKNISSSDEITHVIDSFSQLNFINCQKLADMNDPGGMYWLGYCYEYGIGIEKDEKKAFTWYQKSADMNDYNGMYQVGYCYYLGIGVEIDKNKAFTYYLKSAEAGNFMGIWKTAWCYRYGIGVEESYDKFYKWIKKYSLYGKCAHCNEDNTQPAWCLLCDPDIATRWTSRNKDIDNCIKMFQLRAFAYEDTIEWIPFERLNDVKEIGKGGFGYVYSAIWLDGIRKLDRNYVRTREESSIVALKTLSGSLKEFDNYVKCNFYVSKLKIYGLTQNSENKYLIVFQYADNENLYKFLEKKFQDLTWNNKLKLLLDISNDLYYIHKADYIHADIHGGNILQQKCIKNNIRSYISDLGLSKKHNENDSKDRIYGVMPYIAPEVLSGRPFTKAADIYASGVIMSEISTGQRPFDGYQFNIELALRICNGLRPEFAPGTPEYFIKLAKKCMDSENRPLAIEVLYILRSWIESIEGLDNDEIKKQFLDADNLIKDLPAISPSHPDHMYTSKSIDTQIIAGGLKGYGTCEHCSQNNTNEAWCQTCDPKMETQGWTSGNEKVDNFIKEFQLKALAYTKVIEWIPFDRLNIIQKIGEGGFGSVYFATWLDGIRKIDYVNGRYVRTREQSSEVALKTLPSFEENPLRSLKEFNNHLKCSLMGTKLKIYGLTQDKKTKEYMMVAQYADNGSLYKVLSTEIKKLTWQTKLKLLVSISEELHDIHYAGYIHGDFHSGNILLDKSMRTYISDLGLSRKVDENVSNEIYGVIPYVAPEVLSGKQQFTRAADIYSFGIIMTEMSTGQRPFEGYVFDNRLALKICIEGLRPKFADGTPNCYIELAKQCTNLNPRIRPTAYNIYNQINDWLDKIKDSDYINEVVKRKIKYGFDKIKGFYNVDKIKNLEIDYWHDKIANLNNTDDIIIQLKYWFDKINESEDLDEIKKQFNDKIQGSNYVNEIINHEINCWIDEIKMSNNIEEIIKQLKDWVNKINDSEDADKIKKQIKDQLDKIEGSDYVNGVIKLKIKYWLDEIKVSDEVNEIQKHKIIYLLDKIKVSCDLDEIKRQIKYWLNEIKGSNNLDEIKKQIIYWLDKIKGPDDIETIKEQIKYWVDKIKGLDNIDEITRQFLESDKIVSELPFNFPTHTDQMCTSKIIDTQQISKILTSITIDTEIPEDSKPINFFDYE